MGIMKTFAQIFSVKFPMNIHLLRLDIYNIKRNSFIRAFKEETFEVLL